MDIKAKQQYMETLRERSLKGNKKEKGGLPDEYCRNTGCERKYAIKKFRYKAKLKETRKKRKDNYGGAVKTALAAMWKIFDFPCGQRLEPILKDETDRMRKLEELICSNETANKLKGITSSAIDKKLKHEKEVERNKRKYKPTHTFPLKNEAPTKTSAELDKDNPGTEQIDFVEHCGVSASGEYVNSLSIVDIYSGWWEGDAVIGKGQERALKAIDEARKRCPFTWKETHPDNGPNIMNYDIYEYGINKGIALSRSRPYKKNDNCFAEQKNSAHVRQKTGYLRYDTEEGLAMISDLCLNELRLFKNFFQPITKLVSKTRIKGKIKKKYDTPKTPCKRLMESDKVSQEEKDNLRKIYESLNPALLKKNIDEKLNKLQKIHDKKKAVVSRHEPQKIKSNFGVMINHSTSKVSVS